MKLAAWRLVRAELADTAFDGEGARLHGGRWTPPGLPAVYLAGSRALAALEVLAHLPRALRSAAFVLYRLEFDENEVAASDWETMPGDWMQYPAGRGTQELGRLWLARAERAVWRRPSVLVPEEFNYVVNPRHPRFGRLRPERERVFFFDPRLG